MGRIRHAVLKLHLHDWQHHSSAVVDQPVPGEDNGCLLHAENSSFLLDL